MASCVKSAAHGAIFWPSAPPDWKINLVMAQDTVIETNSLLFKRSISRVIILATEECLSYKNGKLVCGNAP